MKNKLLLLSFLLFSVEALFGQTPIQLDPAENLEELILEDFLKQDDCIEVFNIKPISDLTAIGAFSNGTDAIFMEEGIVFSTGNLENIGKQNSSTNTTGLLYGRADAPYLRQAVRTPAIFDAVGIEFDFTPTQRIISFRYVFASEEYCEYVGSEFNDAFGFFISGPGIEGNGFDNSINIAKIPDSEEIVSINNINHLRNTGFFINNLIEQDAIACEIEYNPESISTIEFDGFTKRLQAIVEVIPCETYHLRLVVADVSDDALDSAVFLEGKSFESSGIASVDARVRGRDDQTVYEDCLEGEFIFRRNRLTGRGTEIILNYTIQGTATMGEDYEFITDSVLISENSFNEVLPIVVIPDTLDEGREFIEIIIESINCDCITRDTAVLFIEDSKEDIGLRFEETFVCVGQEFTFGPIVETGIPPLTYSWSTGDTTETITDELLMPQTYQVTVSDFCGATDSATIEVQIQDIPALTIEGDFDWCKGRNPQELLINFPGQAPWSFHFSIDEAEPILLENITENPFPLSLDQAGTYQFIGFNDEYCVGTIQGEVVVDNLEFDLAYQSFPPSCANANDGRIVLDISGGVAPFGIDWGMENESETVLSGLLAGNYGVIITDNLGCVLRDSIEVIEAQPDANCVLDIAKNIYISTAFSPNDDGINDRFTVYPKYGLIKNASFQIFNRWGGLVFQSDVINEGGAPVFWDGGISQVGVYVCLVKLELVNGSFEYVGQDVVVVR